MMRPMRWMRFFADLTTCSFRQHDFVNITLNIALNEFVLVAKTVIMSQFVPQVYPQVVALSVTLKVCDFDVLWNESNDLSHLYDWNYRSLCEHQAVDFGKTR